MSARNHLIPGNFRKFLLIYNPGSGQGKYRQYLDKTARFFHDAGLTLDIVPTESRGHATELAREGCAGDYDVIIGAGGDGTINEVLNGMAGSGKTLAILPWGTGNVFAAEMNIPSDPVRACRVIADSYHARLDLARIGERYFLLMCGAGFDAYSIKHAEQMNIKRAVGRLGYVLASIKAFPRYRFSEIEVEMDGGIRDKGTFVLVSNTSRYGTFFTISPRAVPNDGLLDVYVFKEAGGRWNFIKLVTQMILTAFKPRTRSKKIFFKKQAYYRAKSVRLCSDYEVPTQIDGELFQPLPAVIKAVPSAIDVILPKRVARRYGRQRVTVNPNRRD
ncbi:MAG: hypothetical protein A2Y33_15605 [Spirochaetes bacterium GWF1_51_8]|nr:MAG: hypothetical protein A2Y33_15605 [Spirochaetes bacterium GWF1_51_8]